MNCSTARQLISCFLDHELAGSKESRLKEHLASCAACRAELDALMRTHEILGALPDVQPAFNVADVKARAAEQRHAPLRGVPAFPWIPQLPRWASALGVTASICLGTLGGLTIHTVLQPVTPQANNSAHASSNVLSLAGFDDPVDNVLSHLLEENQ